MYRAVHHRDVPRITVNVAGDVEEWIEEEADRLNWSKADAGGWCITVMQSSVEHIKPHHDAVEYTTSDRDSEEPDSALAERLDVIEARLAALEQGRAHEARSAPRGAADTHAQNAPVMDEAEDAANDDEPHASQSGPDALTTPAAPADDDVRAAVDAVDWGKVMYAFDDERADAVAAAFRRLREDGRATTPQLVAIVEAADVDVGNPQRLLSDVGREIDAVETPQRGSNRYRWVGK